MTFFTAFKTNAFALYQVFSTLSTHWNHLGKKLKSIEALDATTRDSDLIDLGLETAQRFFKVLMFLTCSQVCEHLNKVLTWRTSVML